MIYRLNKAENVAVTIYHVPQTKKVGGKEVVTYHNFIRLAPGEEYESEDKAMIEFLKRHTRKVRYSDKLARTLEAHNVPYETEMCKSCGGRVKKIIYHVVEVENE